MIHKVILSIFQYSRYILQKFRVPSLARKSLQPFEHRYRTITKYKLWYETPILLLIHARTNYGLEHPPKAVILPIKLH